MPQDVALQTDLSVRLIVAAILGAVIGLERELHGHQAGMRTHMLVALGSAIFTVLSIYGFNGVSGSPNPDPSRIAAQVVTGIGFLGAGAILKFGTNIRGLTTAASLWVVASVGVAAGAGQYLIAATGSVIAVLALWPLHSVVQRLEWVSPQEVRVRLSVPSDDAFARVSQVLLARRIEVVSIRNQRTDARQIIDLDLRIPRRGLVHQLMADLSGIPDVEVQAVTRPDEA